MKRQRKYKPTGEILRTLSLGEIFGLKLEGYTYQQIAVKAGITRQRVQQLLSPPKSVRVAVYERASGRCQCCGIVVGRDGQVHHKDCISDYNDTNNLQFLCRSCHRLAHQKVKYCLSCGKKIRKNQASHIFCSDACRQFAGTIQLVCDGCGRKFRRKEKDAARAANRRYVRRFCSKQCYAQNRRKIV